MPVTLLISGLLVSSHFVCGTEAEPALENFSRLSYHYLSFKNYWRLLTNYFAPNPASVIVVVTPVFLILGRYLEPMLGSLKFSLLFVSLGMFISASNLVFTTSSLPEYFAIYGQPQTAWISLNIALLSFFSSFPSTTAIAMSLIGFLLGFGAYQMRSSTVETYSYLVGAGLGITLGLIKNTRYFLPALAVVASSTLLVNPLLSAIDIRPKVLEAAFLYATGEFEKSSRIWTELYSEPEKNGSVRTDWSIVMLALCHAAQGHTELAVELRSYVTLSDFHLSEQQTLPVRDYVKLLEAYPYPYLNGTLAIKQLALVGKNLNAVQDINEKKEAMAAVESAFDTMAKYQIYRDYKSNAEN